MKRACVVSLVVLSAFALACGRREHGRPEQPDGSNATAVERAPASTAGSPADTRPTHPQIVFLGDSLTAGLGLPLEQSVPSLIQRRLNEEGYAYDVVNQGVSGDTSAGGVSRLDWALTGDVRVLVLELGANDGLRGLPVEQMKKNLADILARAKQRGVRVLLTGMEAPPNHGPAYTAAFRQAYRDLAREYQVAFIPFFLEGVGGIAALNQADGIHPNAEGAQIVSRTIWTSLEPLLEKTDR